MLGWRRNRRLARCCDTRALHRGIQISEYAFEVRCLCIFYFVNVIAKAGARQGLIQAFQPPFDFGKDTLIPSNHENRIRPVHREEANGAAGFGQTISRKNTLQVAD